MTVLAASAAWVGVWALFFPHGFYRSFPGFGRHWVSVDGPYSEHLVRDVGGLYLALLVVSAATIWRPTGEALRLAGLAWLVFSGPHLAYHSAHLDGFSTGDAVAQTVALAATVVLAGLLLLPAAGQDAGANSRTSPVLTSTSDLNSSSRSR
jgi:hypothetical protein